MKSARMYALASALIGLLAASAQAGPVAPTVINQQTGGPTTSASSFQITLNTTPTPGNYLVVMAVSAGGQSTGSVLTGSDSAGNTWTVFASNGCSGSGFTGIGCAFAKVVTAPSTITIVVGNGYTGNAGAQTWTYNVFEVTGIDATNPTDSPVRVAAGAGTGSGGGWSNSANVYQGFLGYTVGTQTAPYVTAATTTPSAPSITTTQGYDIVFSMCQISGTGTSITGTPSGTALNSFAHASHALDARYQVVPTAGTVTFPYTLNNSSSSCSCLSVAFKAAQVPVTLSSFTAE